MEIAILGLGRMGKNMALLLNKKGHDVLGWNRGEEPRKEIEEAGCRTVAEAGQIAASLHEKPRVVWLMLPAGDITEYLMFEVLETLEPGDIIVNGANTHYTETLRHAPRIAEKGVKFLDVGVSGGTLAQQLGGYCCMAGGDEDAFRHIEPIFRDLCVKDGYGFFGVHGTGHYVKMIHNGIEYAHMHAIGEGFEILKNGHFKDQLDLHKISKVWDNGSILAGTLMWATEMALRKDQNLGHIAAYIQDSGEGKWTVEEALKEEIPFSTGAFALFSRWQSREKECFAYKIVAAQRNAFGGHAVKKE